MVQVTSLLLSNQSASFQRYANICLRHWLLFHIYPILSSKVRTFYEQNYDEILPARYPSKIPEKGFKIT